jgi:alpha-1,3-rhamnosyl/mannosyltransferase
MFDAVQEVLPAGFPRLLRWRFAARYRRAATQADVVIVPSRSTALDVERCYGVARSRSCVIPPGVGRSFRPIPADSPMVTQARQAAGLDEQAFFLFVGKRSERRNVPVLLDAFREHRIKYPIHRLVFVGPPGARADSARLRLEPGVVVMGHVAEPVLHGLLASATALLYPSEYEGFGLPILEALASGCPVVTLRSSALPEAGGDAAIYLDRADPQALAEAMERLVNDPGERVRRISLGLAHAQTLRSSTFADAVKREILALADPSEAVRAESECGGVPA